MNRKKKININNVEYNATTVKYESCAGFNLEFLRSSSINEFHNHMYRWKRNTNA